MADDNETVTGSDGPDTIVTGDGRDRLRGKEGDDSIVTGPLGIPNRGYPGTHPADPDLANDRDTVFGQGGDDTISTGDDEDIIFGGSGDDIIDAGNDDDLVFAGSGDDVITSGEGGDTILAGSGDDTIYGVRPMDALPAGILDRPDDGSDPFGPDLVPDNDTDLLYGGAGRDVIFGGDDEDTIFGGTGNDFLHGGVDDDSLGGGAGDDTLVGGQGRDSLRGDEGRDLFRVSQEISGIPDFRAPGSFIGDTVDGSAGGVDFDTLDLRGSGLPGGSFTVTETAPDSNGNGSDGFVAYFDADGAHVGTLEFSEIENIIVCFTPGTRIATPRGEVLVEELRQGDRIITRDNGLQEIAWTGARALEPEEIEAAPDLRPVRIAAGALGNGFPERAMVVSPQHRVLMANEQTQLYFEEREVLAAAKHLVGRPGITRLGATPTTYIHFMCARHEVVLSDGAWTETFQPGDYSLGSMGAASQKEILSLFPELATQTGRYAYISARRALKRHEAALLTAR